MKIRSLCAISLVLSIIGGTANSTAYTLPENGNDSVITQFHDDVPLTRAEQDKTLLDVARRFLLGQTEIVRLNPDVDRWHVRKDEIIRLSDKRILPDTPHEGITLNIAEYRMYYYPPAQKGMAPQVMSYAHGIGRQDWNTPLGKTRIDRKVKDPAWHPPESIRREHAANGDPLPSVVSSGPHNPLGAYMMHLAVPGGYEIHGTDIDKIYGIGMQITHGCVRMYPEDIEELYQSGPGRHTGLYCQTANKSRMAGQCPLYRSASRFGRRGNNAGSEIRRSVEAYSKSQQYRQRWCVCRKPAGNWRGAEHA